jgi:hypothetical protein
LEKSGAGKIHRLLDRALKQHMYDTYFGWLGIGRKRAYTTKFSDKKSFHSATQNEILNDFPSTYLPLDSAFTYPYVR